MYLALKKKVRFFYVQIFFFFFKSNLHNEKEKVRDIYLCRYSNFSLAKRYSFIIKFKLKNNFVFNRKNYHYLFFKIIYIFNSKISSYLLVF